MIKKVFGIISYFPDPDTDYHKYVRSVRTKRCSELLLSLSSLWPTIDIIIIAQNWGDYKPPKIQNKLRIVNSKIKRLGIVCARKVLRQEFLESEYDYLIMLDDDTIISCKDPSVYIKEIDDHPDGVGLVRHIGHPMTFLAISKSIYSLIDYPDIDVEKCEGFGDAVFAESCFALFPDKAFDFTKGCISDLSYKPNHSCPSTWLDDIQLDWKYMNCISNAYIQVVKHKRVPCSNEKDIDIVIPYVDSSKSGWQEAYIKNTKQSEVYSNRFRSWNTLKYLLRGIDRYMPFVRNVVLIVSDETQVPEWITNVTIVYHKDFIPEKFLPTYNSCTIEAFLSNIKGLSEKFIYFNDDIFPIDDMVASDFFVDEKPLLQFKEHNNLELQDAFSLECRSSINAVTTMLNLPDYDENELIVTEHSAMPMLKSSVKNVAKSLKDVLEKSISQTRTPQNINQYIYHYYQFFTGNYIDDFCPYVYTEIDDNLFNIRHIILNSKHICIVCINDMGTVADYDTVQRELVSIFETKFPEKCKYEN